MIQYLAKCAVVLGLICSTPAFAVNPEVTALRSQRDCQFRLGMAAASYAHIQKTWLTDATSQFNVGNHFQLLKQRHHTYFTAVQNFISESVTIDAAQRGQFDAIMQALYARYRQTIAGLSDTLIADDAFVYSLNTIDKALAVVADDLVQINATTCNHAPSIATAAQMLADVQAWSAKLKEISAVVATVKDKRQNLLQLALEAMRNKYAAEWARRASKDLAQIQQTIDSIFQAETILRECHEWYRNFAINSEFSQLAHQYLQYEEPLRRMRVARFQGNSYLTALEKIALPPETKTEAIKQVTVYLKTLDRSIAEHEALGWQGLFARQRLFNQKRRDYINKLKQSVTEHSSFTQQKQEIVDQYATTCLGAINKYDKLAPNVLDLAAFRNIERQYVTIYKACFVKR